MQVQDMGAEIGEIRERKTSLNPDMGAESMEFRRKFRELGNPNSGENVRNLGNY